MHIILFIWTTQQSPNPCSFFRYLEISSIFLLVFSCEKYTIMSTSPLLLIFPFIHTTHSFCSKWCASIGDRKENKTFLWTQGGILSKTEQYIFDTCWAICHLRSLRPPLFLQIIAGTKPCLTCFTHTLANISSVPSPLKKRCFMIL